MRLILPNPELTWNQIGREWFLDLEPGTHTSYVGTVSQNKSGYSWNAYSYLEYSSNDIGSGDTESLEEAKKKVEETLIAAGVAQ